MHSDADGTHPWTKGMRRPPVLVAAYVLLAGFLAISAGWYLFETTRSLPKARVVEIEVLSAQVGRLVADIEQLDGALALIEAGAGGDARRTAEEALDLAGARVENTLRIADAITSVDAKPLLRVVPVLKKVEILLRGDPMENESRRRSLRRARLSLDQVETRVDTFFVQLNNQNIRNIALQSDQIENFERATAVFLVLVILGATAIIWLETRQRRMAIRQSSRLEEQVEERTRALTREIEGREAMEAALRISEERFRDMADSASDWFWEMGSDLRLIYLSDRFEERIGVKAETLMGETQAAFLQRLGGEADPESLERHREDLAAHRAFRGFEFTIRDANGDKHWILSSGKPVLAPDGTFRGYRGVGQDVSGLRAREAELEEARDAAEGANHAKTEFLSRMSHELRTPLNAILGFGQFLELEIDAKLAPRQRENVGHILSAGRHLLDLVDEILDLSRIDAGRTDLEIETLSAESVVAEATALVSRQASARRVTLHDGIAGSAPPAVRADRLRLRQVLVNLIGNAVKYNREGGDVFLSWYKGDGGRLRFVVEDTGCGLPEHRLHELFKPFNRLGADAKAIEGSGIGLALSKRLVELMGGDIGATNRVDEGSRFWVEVPITEGEAPVHEPVSVPSEPAAIPPTAPPAAGDDRRLLLYVEDNPGNQRLMREIVGVVPEWEMVAVENAEEGLEMARRREPDMIFLDLELPGMSGWEAVRHFRAEDHLREIPILALSAHAFAPEEVRCREAGFTDFLAKPLDLAKVMGVLGKGRDHGIVRP